MKQQKFRVKKRFVWLLLIVLIIGVGWGSLQRSLFLQNRERINILIYGKEAVLFSLNLQDDIHYAALFSPDMKLSVPGGYGSYRVGALGKLVQLEKNPDLLRKAFSLATLTFTDYYFFYPVDDIFYGEDAKERVRVPSARDILFMQSNAKVFDRIYLALQFLGKRSSDFSTIQTSSTEDFMKRYQGFFYRNIYREEQKNVQMQYRMHFTTAQSIADILEGNGIRIADMSQVKGSEDRCVVKEEGTSVSAIEIAHFFNCRVAKGKTGIYDIIFLLNDLEKSWEVK